MQSLLSYHPFLLSYSTHLLYTLNLFQLSFFFLRFSLFIFRQRGREGERETSMCGCLSHAPYWGLAHNPGLCPD